MLQSAPESRAAGRGVPIRDSGAIPAAVTAHRFEDEAARINRLIADIDDLLNDQVNAILHHPRVKALEAAWRGLKLVVDQAAPGRGDVKIKAINVSWKELERDAVRAGDFDRSHLFELIYTNEFGMPGGEPFGLLIGAYELKGRADETDDVYLLKHLGGIAAAAFCPFTAGAAPEMFGLDSFADMEPVFSLRGIFDTPDHLRWRQMRRTPDMRFAGLTLPRVLLRPAYQPHTRRRMDSFLFEEEIDSDGNALLWGPACFALGSIMIRRFLESGWFADIRGAVQDEDGAGMVSFLPTHDFGTEHHGASRQPPVDMRLNSMQELELSELGFVPVVALPYTSHLVFNTNPSLHEPERYDRLAASQNARLAAMLQYVMCASRFAHCLKALMRDRIGRVESPEAMRDKLEAWLSRYTIGNSDASEEFKIAYPLRNARADVRELPGRPGVLGCTIHLQPHFQLDDVAATSFQLVAEMTEEAR